MGMNPLKGYSLNAAALEMIEKVIIPKQEALGIEIYQQKNGVHILDFGINTDPGWIAGKYFTELSLGGLGELKYTKLKIGEYYMPAVEIIVDYPVIAELSSHDAFWYLGYAGAKQSFSGPVRAKIQDAYAKKAPYEDLKAEKVLAFCQISHVPCEEWTSQLAADAGVAPENFYLVVARTGTLVGAIHIAARNVEQTIPTLVDKGFDLSTIVYASGITPVIASVEDETEAYGVVNDNLLYGQETNIYCRCADVDIIKHLDNLCLNQPGNKDVYGMPFKDIFASCDNEWCNVPRPWDAPSKVNFFNLSTGRTFTAGKHHEGVLVQGFLGKKGGRVK